MKKFLISTLLCLCNISYADEWVEITSAKNKTYSVKATSIQIGKNDSNVPVVISTGKINYLDTGKIEAYMWYVPLSHCNAKQGTMGITDVLGNYQAGVEFVFGLGTVGSQIAQTLCAVSETLGTQNKSKINI